MKKEKFSRKKSFNKKITIMIIILSGIMPLLSLDFIGMHASFAQNDNNVSLSNINKTNTIIPSCELTFMVTTGETVSITKI